METSGPPPFRADSSGSMEGAQRGPLLPKHFGETVMPLFGSQQTLGKVDWGTAKGSVRLIHVEPAGEFSSYVIEEPPEMKTVAMKNSHISWSHDVMLPWRYSVIRVRWDARVSLANAGWFYYANSRVEKTSDPALFPAVFPNVFKNGSMCLGVGGLWDRTCVRAAWRAVRRIYSISNQWIHTHFPVQLSGAQRDKECFYHVCKAGTRDPFCLLSKMSKDEIALVDWNPRKLQPISIEGAASNCSLTRDYQGHYLISEEMMDGMLRESRRGRMNS